MSKVNGPLFSLHASGTLADTLTFSRWKGRKYVRQRVVPANPRTPAQVAVRTRLVDVIGEWHHPNRTVEDKQAYKVKATKRGLGISGFNLFCRIYLQVLNDDRTPVYYRGISASWDSTTKKITITGTASAADNTFKVRLYNKNGTLIGEEDAATESGLTTINWTSTDTYDEKPELVELVDASTKPNGETGYYTITTA